LHPANPVAERVAVTIERARGTLPLSVALDEGLQGAHQLSPVRAFGVLDRGEDGIAEQPQSFVVLQREQQLERAEVAIGGQRSASVVGSVAVQTQLARLQRATGLVEAAPQVGG